jgi:peptidoglycan/LPS O-acetylase OafA/YrhL
MHSASSSSPALAEVPHAAADDVSRANAWLWHGRVPSLDGLRAISIIGVLVCHAAWAYPNKFPGPSWTIAIEGTTGVDVFFIISGFLITLLMLREKTRMGTARAPEFRKARVPIKVHTDAQL